MSDYIYRPPPPPPTPSSSTPTPNRAGYNNGQRGGFQAGRNDRGGRDGGRGGNSGGGRSGRRGGRRHANPNYQASPQRGNSHPQTPQQYYAHQQQRTFHPLPQFPPQTHFNPAFLAQQPLPPQLTLIPQQSCQAQFFTPPANSIYNIPGFSSQTPPTPPPKWRPSSPQPPVQPDSPYLSYSQEQYNVLYPLAPQSQPPQWPQELSPVAPQNCSYTDISSGWPTQSSYSYFELPQQPTAPKQAPLKNNRRGDRPDMDEDTWLSLNGGKLLGTDIAPPETPEEIEAWIKERKARFPTAKKIIEEQEKKEAEKEAKKKAWEAQAQNTTPHEPPSTASPSSFKKRKRPTTTSEGEAPPAGPDAATDSNSDASDSDSDNEVPEAVSTKTKSTLPEAPTTGRKHEPKSKKKLPAICNIFAARGKCHRGDGCKFRHETREPKRKEKKVEDNGKKTLYQRLVEHDREKENALMLQVIKYLADKGKLQEEDPKV